MSCDHLNSLIGVHQLILSDLCDDPGEERQFVAQAHEGAEADETDDS